MITVIKWLLLKNYCTKIFDVSILCLVQSLLYLPFAIANALASRLNDGYVLCFCILNTVDSGGSCYLRLSSVSHINPLMYFWQDYFSGWEISSSWLLCIYRYSSLFLFYNKRWNNIRKKKQTSTIKRINILLQETKLHNNLNKEEMHSI